MGTISRGELPVVGGQRGGRRGGGGGSGDGGGNGGGGSGGPNTDPERRSARTWQTLMQFAPAFDAAASSEQAARQAKAKEQIVGQNARDTKGRKASIESLVTYRSNVKGDIVYLQTGDASVGLQHIIDKREYSDKGRLAELQAQMNMPNLKKTIEEIVCVAADGGFRYYPETDHVVTVKISENGFIRTAMGRQKRGGDPT